MEEPVEIVEKTITSGLCVEALQRQVDPKHREIDPYMKYNKVMMKAGRTQMMR